MIELLVIVVLCGVLCWKEYQGRKERKELLNVIISKNAAELANLQYIDKVKLEPQKNAVEEIDPDLRPVEDLTDKEFDDFIKDAGK